MSKFGIRTFGSLLVALGLVAVAVPAQADHVCYTPGDVQVCTSVPGDHLVEELLGPGPQGFSCLTPGDFQFCIEVPGGETLDQIVDGLLGPSSFTCLTPGDFQFCIEVPGGEVVDGAVNTVIGVLP